jgi:outer membrane protein OmpA-like peptidoglycan-associated protein
MTKEIVEMKRFIGALSVILVLMGARPSEAGTTYQGTGGLIRAREAATVGKGILDFQLMGHYYASKDDTLTVGLPNAASGGTSAVVDYHFFMTRATLSYGLNDNVEVSANLEVRNWIRDPVENNGNDLDVFTRGGIGDTQLSGKVAVPTWPHLSLGAYGEVSLPTGNEDRGFSTDARDFLVLGLATLDFTDVNSFVPTRVHVNAGYHWNRNETDGYGSFLPDYPDSAGFWAPNYPASTGFSQTFNDQFLFNAAVEFPSPMANLFVEFQWDQFANVDDQQVPAGYSKSTFWLTPGLAIPFGNGFELKGAGDINLNSETSQSVQSIPDWGVWFAVSKSGAVIPQDMDGDGISDDDDRCPDQPEDVDGQDDSDGCPDPDNDSDVIPDVEDTCPDLAEDIDGFEDSDGCPDLDNDQDGVADVDDRCLNEPEDFDGDQDDDGCPDLVKDSDADNVPDDLDQCPLQAEDVDGFEDEDGCPDLDNDLDGVPDIDDQCPNAAETFNGFEDEDGCPDERPIDTQFILQGVTFESGSAALTQDSYRVLDEVVRSLMAYPEVRVEIQGYTDSVGKASANLTLSQKRAESVRQYLANAGIDPARLGASGFGEENPISSNSTPSGRAQNRRIEFKRLN